MTNALPEKNDLLTAHKALNLVADLPEDTRRVAAALLDHFNRKTGQCDPSVGRLSEMLGINETTVVRATDRLHARGLIEKRSHGGKSHRASYQPVWSAFRAIVGDWEARMKTGEKQSKCEALQGSTLQRFTSEHCSASQQTNLSNQAKKPSARGTDVTEPQKHSEPTGQQGLRSGKSEQLKRAMVIPFQAQRSPSHSDAARQQATRRWNEALIGLGYERHADVIERITEAISDEATEAEMRRRGAGIGVVLTALTLRRPMAMARTSRSG